LAHPDYVLADVQHLPSTRLQPVLVIARQGDRTVGVGALVPKRVTSKRLGGIGFDCGWQGLRLAGNVWLTAKNDVDVVSGLTEAALDHVQSVGARFLLVEDVDVDSPLAGALGAGRCPNLVGWAAPTTTAGDMVGTAHPTRLTAWLQYRHAGVQSRRRILFPSSRDEYWGRFSKKSLSTLRRKLKKFGETRLERITDIAHVPRFLEIAHRISLQTWQSRQFGLRVRNDAAELDGLATLANHGLLRSYLWFSNDEPVGFLVGQQDKGVFHYEEVGYATPFAKYSPGLVMLMQVLDDLIEHDRPRVFDFGGGDADYKQFFANDESRSGTVWLFPPGWGNRLAVGHLQVCAAVRRWARHAVAISGWAQRARQWVRYGGARTVVRPSHSAEE
jgi:hypothetical protein